VAIGTRCRIQQKSLIMIREFIKCYFSQSSQGCWRRTGRSCYDTIKIGYCKYRDSWYDDCGYQQFTTKTKPGWCSLATDCSAKRCFNLPEAADLFTPEGASWCLRIIDKEVYTAWTRTKHGVNRMIRRGDIAIWIFQDGSRADILDLAKPEIAPFDPPTPKTPS